MTRKTRRKNAVALSLAGIGLALIVIALYVVGTDHGYLKTEVERRLSAALGRQLAIDGDMHLTIRRSIRLSVEGLRVVSEDWTEKPDLVRIGRLSATLRTSSLFGGPVEILDLAIDDTLICLEKHPDGRVNWDLGGAAKKPDAEPEAPGGVPLVLRSAAVTRTRAVLKSPDLEQKLYVTIDTLTQSIDDAGVIDTVLAGDVNDTSLDFALRVDSLPALLAGRDVGMTVDGSLGEIRLDGDMTLDELAQPGRPSVDLQLRGPDFAYLAAILKLPEHHSGALAFDVELQPEGDHLAFDIAGEIGAFKLSATGRVDDLAEPKSLETRVEASGPNAAAFAAVFGAEHVPALPYAVSGHLVNHPEDVRFDGLRVSLGKTAATASGVLRPADDFAFEAQVSVQGPDAAEPGRWFELPGIPADAFAGSASVRRTHEVIRFDDLQFRLGPNELYSGSMAIRTGDAPSVDMDIAVAGPDAGEVAGWFGIEQVPALPFTANARLRPRKGELRLDDLEATLGPNELRSRTATVVTGDTPVVDMDFAVAGPDAGDLAGRFGVRRLPAEAFSASGRLNVRDGTIRLDALLTEVAANRLTGDMSIRAGAGLALEGELALQGPDAAKIAAWFDIAPVPSLPFTAKARVREHNGEWRLDDLQVHLGPNEFHSKSATIRTGDTLSVTMDLNAAGPDAADVARWFDVRRLPEEPFAVTGQLAAGGGSIRFDELGVRLGPHEFGGSGAFRPGDVRWFDLDLAADRLDISEFTGPGDAAPTTAKPRRRDDGRVIPDTRIPLEHLALFRGSARLDIAELVLDAKTLRDVRTRMQVDDRQRFTEELELTGAAGGRFSAALAVEPAGDSGFFRLRLSGRNVELGLPADTEEERRRLPRYEVDAALEASGRTFRDLAATANGYVKLVSGPGRVRTGAIRFFTNDFLSQLLRTVNPFLKDDPYTEIECAVLFATVEDGVVRGNPGLVVRSKRLHLLAQAEINLATEAVDANINTVPRQGLGISMSNLVVSPFTRVGGTIAQPRFRIDEKSSVIQGGAAIATGGLSLIAKSLFDRATVGENPCVAAEQAAAPEFEALARKYGGDPSTRQ